MKKKAASILLVITLIFGIIQPLFSVLNFNAFAGGEEEDLEDGKGVENLQKFDLLGTGNISTEKFSMMELKVTTTSGSSDIEVQLDFKLNNKYLSDKRMDYIYGADDILKLIEEGEELSTVDAAIDNKYKDDSSFPALDFSFSFLKEYFDALSDSSEFKISSKTYGMANLVESTESVDAKYGITFLPRIYNHTDITGGVSFTIEYLKETALDILPIFKIEDDKLTLDYVSYITPAGEVSEDNQYAIKKQELHKDESSPEFFYKIDVGAYKELNGITVIDEIPFHTRSSSNHYLTTDQIEIKIGEDKSVVTFDEAGVASFSNTKLSKYIEECKIDTSAQKIIIKFNALDSQTAPTNKIKSASINVNMLIAPECLAHMSEKTTFTNKAYILENNVEKCNAEVETDKKITMMLKNGTQSQIDGSLFDWTIDAELFFYTTGTSKVYLIDRLSPSEHNYNLDNGVTVKNIGKNKMTEYRVSDIAILDVEADNITFNYSNATAKQIETALGDSKCGYVKISDSEALLFIDITSQLLNSKSEQTNLQIMYQTKISEATYNDNLDNDKEKSISNDVDLRWMYMYYGSGNGPSVNESGLSFSINKDAPMSVNSITKSAGEYDMANQLQEWIFDVNKYKREVKNLVITEALGDNDQIMASDYLSKNHIMVQKYDSNGELSESNLAQSYTGVGDTAPYYTVSADNKTVVITLGDITEHYKVTLVSKVIGDTIATQSLRTQVNGIDEFDTELENEAKATSTGSEKDVLATNGIENVLISKNVELFGSGDGAYNFDFTNRLIKWSTIINPNKLTLVAPVITDTLPEGTAFDELKEIYINDVKVTIASIVGDMVTLSNNWKIKITQDNDNSRTTGYSYANTYSRKTVKFELLDSTESSLEMSEMVKLVYTTVVDDEFCDKEILETNNTGMISLVNMINKVVLNGSVKCQDYNESNKVLYTIKKATAEANVVIASQNLSKSSKYNGDGTITWTVRLNQIQANIAGMKLSDTFTANMEMMSDSLKVWLLTLDDSGKETARSNVTASFDMTNKASTKTENTFDINLPTGSCNSVYLIEYTTIIVDDCNPIDIWNRIELYNGSVKVVSTPEVAGGLENSFSMDSYQSIANVPVLMIDKISANLNNSNLNKLKLKGAEFELWAVNLDEDGKPLNEELQSTKVTDASGRILFVNLKQDQLYKIVESGVPKGYSDSDTVHYMYYVSLTTSTSRLEQIKELEDEESKVIISAKETAYFKKVSVANTPSTGSFTFYNLIEDKNSSDVLAGTTYKITSTLGESTLGSKTVSADKDGKVIFTNLDPGEYNIEQVSNLDNYKKLEGELTLNVSVDSNGDISYELKIKDSSKSINVNANSTGDYAGKYTVRNILKVATLNIVKEDKNTSAKLQGAIYSLTGTNAEGVTKTFLNQTTSASGVASFVDIPVGTYTLTEETYPEGYDTRENISSVKKTYTVEVTATNDSQTASIALKDGSTTIAKVGVNHTLTNTPVKGSISFTKTGKNISGTYTSLAGAVFEIYRVNGSTEILLEAKTTTSDSNGLVKFEDLDYGYNYKIVEKSTKAGFLKVASFTITKAQLLESLKETNGVKNSFEYAHTEVKNEYAKADVKISKTDQNSKALSGVVFKLYRLGDATTLDVSVLSDNVFVNYPDASTTYTTGSDGTISLGSIPYGMYKLVETTPPGSVRGNPNTIYFKVGIENNSAVVSKLEDASNDLDETELNEKTFTKITKTAQETAYTISVVNEIKFGYVQINKVIANYDSEGKLVASSLPVRNVKFNIYTKEAVDNRGATQIKDLTPFLSLTTNSDGHFNIADETVDGSRLLLGSYYIQEAEVGSGYSLDSKLYTFDITKDQQVVYITNYDANDKDYAGVGDATSVSYDSVGDVLNPPAFINVVETGKVILNKVDKDVTTKKLTKAQFIIYTEADISTSSGVKGTLGKAVASLVYSEVAEGYVLSNVVPSAVKSTSGLNKYGLSSVTQTIFSVKNESEISYLSYSGGEYSLLSGDYIVEEVASEEGYMDDTTDLAKRKFTITSNSVTDIKNHATQNIYINEKINRTVTVNKGLVLGTGTFMSDSNSIKYNSKKDYSFTLTRVSDVNTSDGSDSGFTYTATTLTTDIDGKIDFTNVPYGKYTLSENEVSEKTEAFVLSNNVTIMVTKDGIFVGESDVAVSTVNVNNTLKISKITGTSIAKDTLSTAEKIDLNGVTIGLFDNAQCTGTPITTTLTNTKGEFSFDKVAYGTYYIKQAGQVPDGLSVDTHVVTVSVNANGTVYNTASGLAATFINTAKYGKVTIDKVDKNDTTKKLTKVQFIIYTVSDDISTTSGAKGTIGKAVASLVYNASTQKYELSDALPVAVKTATGLSRFGLSSITQVKLSVKNALGINYLINTGSGFELLVGNYIVEEVEAQEGYKSDVTLISKRTFAVDVSSTTVVSNDDSNKYLNEMIRMTVNINKAIDLADKVIVSDVNASEYKDKENFSFSLIRISDINTQDGVDSGITYGTSGKVTLSTDSKGSISFTNVPYGYYRLTENSVDGKTGRYILPEDVYVLVDEKGVNYGDKYVSSIVRTNKVKTANITGGSVGKSKEEDTFEIRLKDISIGLYTDLECTQLLTSTTTNANGDYSFKDVAYGKYYVKQIEDSVPEQYNPDLNVLTLDIDGSIETNTLNDFVNIMKENIVEVIGTQENIDKKDITISTQEITQPGVYVVSVEGDPNNEDINNPFIEDIYTHIVAEYENGILVLRDEDGNIIDDNTFSLMKYVKRGDIKGKVITNLEEPIKEVVIGVFPLGTTEFTRENLYQGIYCLTDSDGYFEFKNLPYGEYMILEIEIPTFYLSNVSYDVNINKNAFLFTYSADGYELIFIHEIPLDDGGEEEVEPPKLGDETDYLIYIVIALMVVCVLGYNFRSKPFYT